MSADSEEYLSQTCYKKISFMAKMNENKFIAKEVR
jgi:hypothetical protein